MREDRHSTENEGYSTGFLAPALETNNNKKDCNEKLLTLQPHEHNIDGVAN